MPKIKDVWGLLAFQSGLILTLLAVVFIGQLGVVAMIFGEHIAYAYIYPVASIGIQVLSYIAIPVILYLMVWGFVSYFRNRGKPIEPNEEVRAIRDLGKKIDTLIDIIKQGDRVE